LLIISIANKQRYYWTSDNLRELSHIKLNFLCLGLLLNRVDEVIRPLLMTLQFLVQGTIIVCNYLLIETHEESSFVSLVILFGLSETMNVAWISMIHVSSGIHKVSKEAIQSWRCSGISEARMRSGKSIERKLFKKFRRSCKPLGIKWGNFFIATRYRILEFCIVVSKGTSRLLIAL
jgi:hypothetical protein